MTNVHACLTDTTLIAISCNSADQRELEQWEAHLETCPACCEQLESLSAEEQTWRLVRSHLPDDDHDLDRFTCSTVGDAGSTETADLLEFLAPTDDPGMLGRLGGYEISGIIGVGGMGIVLKAFEPSLSRFVALKVLAPQFWKDSDARRRFAREARAAASIVHECVIEIYGVNEVNGIPFFTMPYLRGGSLQKRIDRQGPLQPDQILRIAMQVASGLAAAHAQGLVHRDVKPTNILLSDGAERVRLTDFGIARLAADPRITQTGVVPGTPQYMSPEQVHGEDVDGRSDLFSLGSVMYAMCTGRPPFAADSNYKVLNQVVTADPQRIEQVNPAMPTWLAAVISKLHARNPADRFQSARELAGQLEQCLASMQQPNTLSQPRTVTRLDARYRRQRRTSTLRRRIFWGGLLMLVTGAIGMAFLAGGILTAPPADSSSISVHGRLVDDQGSPVAGATILAVQKTWPNGRFRQDMLRTKTGMDGHFEFKDFAETGNQYAFMLTVLSEQWLMTSEYRLVKDGRQQDAVVLSTQKAEPVTLQFRDPAGKPLPGLQVLPTRRVTKDGDEHFTYEQQVRRSALPTNKNGEVRFGSWQAGEDGRVLYMIGGEIGRHDFTVPDDHVVRIAVKPAATKPSSGAQVHLSGQVVDANGKPVANTPVLAIQKTWPNNRYRQNALTTKTGPDGKFRFDKFADGGRYAYLLTVIADGYAMMSEYKVVRNGAQQEPITLKLDAAEPVTFVFQDAAGKPIAGVHASPSERQVKKSMFLNYSMHIRNSSKQTDENGAVSFTAWKPGDTGKVYYVFQQQTGEHSFEVGDDRRVVVRIPGS